MSWRKDAGRVCARCGKENAPSATACAACRRPLGPRSEKPTLKDQDAPGTSGLVLEPWIWQPTIGRRTPATRRADERHFLVPPFGDALRLPAAAGTAIVLGRDETCDLRISSPTVSRRHAELRFEGAPLRALIRDLGTVNKTRVNEEVLEGERALESGDTIRLGDVTAIYRKVGAGKTTETVSASDVGGATAAIAIPPAEGRGLAGEVRFLPPGALLERLAELRASGTLHVSVDGVTGLASVREGAVSEARFGGREGETALRALAELRRGHFRFEPAPPP